MSSSHPLYSNAAIPLPQVNATDPLSTTFGTVSGQRLAQAVAADERGITAVYANSAARIAQTGYALVQTDIDNMRFFRQSDTNTLWIVTGTLAAPVWQQVGGGSAERIFVAATASEALVAGNFVNLYDVAGVLTVRKADATTVGKEAKGFVLVAVAAAASATVYLNGNINSSLTGLTNGASYSLSTTAGGIVLSSAEPSATGNVAQVLGIALSATSLMVDIEEAPTTM